MEVCDRRSEHPTALRDRFTISSIAVGIELGGADGKSVSVTGGARRVGCCITGLIPPRSIRILKLWSVSFSATSSHQRTLLVTCPTDASDDPSFMLELARRRVEALRINSRVARRGSSNEWLARANQRGGVLWSSVATRSEENVSDG